MWLTASSRLLLKQSIQINDQLWLAVTTQSMDSLQMNGSRPWNSFSQVSSILLQGHPFENLHSLRAILKKSLVVTQHYDKYSGCLEFGRFWVLYKWEFIQNLCFAESGGICSNSLLKHGSPGTEPCHEAFKPQAHTMTWVSLQMAHSVCNWL